MKYIVWLEKNKGVYPQSTGMMVVLQTPDCQTDVYLMPYPDDAVVVERREPKP